MDCIVGTFNQPSLYTLHFSPPTASSQASLTLIRDSPALGAHSWLSLSKDHRYLYATAWTEPSPSVAAYRLQNGGRELQFLNARHVKNLSGYVCTDGRYVYSAGGATGDVFMIEGDGSLGEAVQHLDFVTDQGANRSEQRGDVPHGDFGGLRHGAHSADLSPDGRSLYVADIGRNCIWTYSVTHTQSRSSAPLVLVSKHISPRETDGPRHAWPHPNGKVLYSLQEHSSMVDAFSIDADRTRLQHVQGVKIIPADKDAKAYWADEVRLSTGPLASSPRYLYASTRGLEADTKGYVAVFALRDDGLLDSEEAIDIWETPTSGGLANAIEPAPWIKGEPTIQYLALTDSQEGSVSILSFDGDKIREVARLHLGMTEGGKAVGAATAVWVGSASRSINFMR